MMEPLVSAGLVALAATKRLHVVSLANQLPVNHKSDASLALVVVAAHEYRVSHEIDAVGTHVSNVV